MTTKKHLYSFITIALALSLLSVSCSKQSGAESDISRTNETVSAAELIKQADDLYKQREDLAKTRESISLLKRARALENDNFEIAWRLAQANYFLGKHSTDAKESEKSFTEGINAARAAIRINPNKADGHFWLGANLGGEAEKSPFTKGVTAVGGIREAMQKVVEIQPDYMGASAYDALAQVELKGRIAGAGPEKALEYLEKCMAIDKTNPYANLHLAETFLALDRKAEAKKQIDILLKMKPHPDFQPEHNDAIRQAKRLLETKF